MQKEYRFRFSGTRESFLKSLDRFSTNNSKLFYVDDYLIECSDENFSFGIERMGHSGGNWFVAKVIELDDCIELVGTIEYIGPKPEKNPSKIRRIIDKIGDFLLFILFLPVVIIIWAALFIIRFIKKLFRHDTPKPKNTEEKLYYLMEKYLNCIRA